MVYPVANATARYWVARSTLVPAEDGSVAAHIYDIQPADEWHSHVNDSGKIVMRSRFVAHSVPLTLQVVVAFTNGGAAHTLRFAADAAERLGDAEAPVEAWRRLADQLVIIHNATTGATAEYDGYDGGLTTPVHCPVITPASIVFGTPCIKQADTTLLQYPLYYRNLSKAQAVRDLEYYAPRIVRGAARFAFTSFS